ncbi:hypothetical protein NDA13_001425 [Ustilago tritici]|nr:hypothetical protein NDA13_001425 [Ustilago tritici]
MRPPPSLSALVRAGPSQSDSLLGLLALATKICRLAADIVAIDRAPPRAFNAGSTRSRSSSSSQNVSSVAPLECDFLCSRVSAGSLHSSSGRLSPVALWKQQIRAQAYTATGSQSSLSYSTAQRRHASTATASTKQVDTHVDHQANPQSYTPYHSPSTADLPLHRSQDAVANFDTIATEFGSLPPHWIAPLKRRTRRYHNEDSSVNRLFDRAIAEERAEFRPGYRERNEINGITLRRLAGHRLWHLYRQHAHKEMLSLASRVLVATSLATNVHMVTTNKAIWPSYKALRFLYGQRINAILQDCNIMLEKADTSKSRSSSILAHSNLGIALLQPIAVALQAQPISALKLMDEVLVRCRPDIYRYKNDHEIAGGYMSPINITLHTIMDSLNFEIQGRFDPATIAESISSQPQFFGDDTGLLNDVKEHRVHFSETDHPIKASLEWFMASPHAFLLSHTSAQVFNNCRILFLHCVSQVEDPHELLEELAQDHDAEEPAFVEACELLLRSILVNKGSEAALEVYDDLWSRGVPMSDTLISRIIQSSKGQGVSARMEAILNRSTRPPGRKVSIKLLRVIAQRWASRNRIDLVQKLLAVLKRRGFTSRDGFSREIYTELAAARGDVQTVHEKLAELHDFEGRTHEECEEGKSPLNGRAYRQLIQACNRAGDIDLAEHYLTQALERGIRPRTSDFNLLVDMHVRRTNIDAALAIFDEMKEFGVQPDKYTYTILINGFALRRDSESAAHALRAMIAAGVTPDRITYAALLNCYVESGLYDAAIRLFAWMKNHRDVRLRPTIEVCNIILKAYVLSSMPVQKVMQLVRRVREMGLNPNTNTYALMLQSACDAGLMHLAEEIFTEAERALPSLTGVGNEQGANLYHFTIMIHGYLRFGDHTEAKEYFDEMQSRKLTPSSVTWNIMVRSYAHSENEATYDLACTLVSQLVAYESKKTFRPTFSDGTLSPTKKSKAPNGLGAKHSPPLVTLYTTLMVAQARRGEPEKVEKTLKQMSRRTPALSVYAMTPLLDAYRRAGDVETALETFEQIYEAALEAVSSRSHRIYAYAQPKRKEEVSETASNVPTSATRRQDASSRNLLCLPVSIMIDLLSEAGRHEEIAKIWARAKNDGFGFDSDNWNHLAASMARAGQLEEALSVVEYVLYHDPPNAWMRSRVREEGRKLSRTAISVDKEVEGDDPLDLARHSNTDEAVESDGEAREGQEEFDPLPPNTELDPAVSHRSDATSAPSNPPGRRDQSRSDDDPYTEPPFDRPEPSPVFEGEDIDGEEFLTSRNTADAEEEFVEPSAYYLDSNPFSPSLTRALSSDMAARFSPWYAHFGTMEAISRGLADMKEARKVIQLLDRYKNAASLLDLHERKVEIIGDRQREEAERSARDLIDGRS